MLLKNILLGLGGSAAIGGIGYGIYASSQSNDEEKITIGEQEEVIGSMTNSDVGNGGDSQKQVESPDQNSNASPIAKGDNGASGEKTSSSGGTTPETLPVS